MILLWCWFRVVFSVSSKFVRYLSKTVRTSTRKPLLESFNCTICFPLVYLSWIYVRDLVLYFVFSRLFSPARQSSYNIPIDLYYKAVGGTRLMTRSMQDTCAPLTRNAVIMWEIETQIPRFLSWVPPGRDYLSSRHGLNFNSLISTPRTRRIPLCFHTRKQAPRFYLQIIFNCIPR